jgi:hypothetical protein
MGDDSDNPLSRVWKESDMDRCYSLGEFARQNDIGLSTVRGEIRAGRLAARKIGRRTIIAAEDARAWQEQLPKVQSRVRASDGVR